MIFKQTVVFNIQTTLTPVIASMLAETQLSVSVRRSYYSLMMVIEGNNMYFQYVTCLLGPKEQ